MTSTVDPANDAGVRDTSGAIGARRFVTTHWSVVLAAGGGDTVNARIALEHLCRAYWRPLYAYARRRGYGFADAEDLTQGFLARLLEREALAVADPRRGRFRSFLIAALNHYVSDEWDKARAQKRGGRLEFVDCQSEEARLARAVVEADTPERLYERRWAVALLEQVYQRLEAEFQRQGRGPQFAVLRVALAGGRGAVPYAALGQQLGMTEAAVKMAVVRLRRRYRDLLRETIAETVSRPEEIEDELCYLRRVLAD
jgi:RNA polymerase sigma-70 factor (ECF subfamily)